MIKDQYEFTKNYLEKYFQNLRNGTDYDPGQPVLVQTPNNEFLPTAFIFPDPEATEPSLVLTVAGGTKDEFLMNLVVLSPMLAGSHLILAFDSYTLQDHENIPEEYEGLTLEERFLLQEEGEDGVFCCINVMGTVPPDDIFHISSLGYKEMVDGKIVFTNKGLEYAETGADDIGGHMGQIFTWLSVQLKQDPTETVHSIWRRFLNEESAASFFSEGEDRQLAIDAWDAAAEMPGAIEAARQIILRNMMVTANWQVLSMSEAEGKAVIEVNDMIKQEPHESEIVRCLTNAKLIM